jgi:hypothetical protein
MALAEGRNGVVIGMLIGGQVTERDIFVRGRLDAPRTGDALGLAVHQQPQHQQRMIS